MSDKPKPRSSTPPANSFHGEPARRELGGRSQDGSRKVPASSGDDELESDARQSGDRTHESDIRDQTPPVKRPHPSGNEERGFPGPNQPPQKKLDVKPSQGQRSGRQGSEVQRDKGRPDPKSNRPQGGSPSGR